MMKYARIHFILLMLIQACHLTAQTTDDAAGKDSFTIFSWNVENLFDTLDDSLVNDDEFTPGGIRSWDNYRYYLKTRAVWKTILSVPGGRPPEIIALCEIENTKVLHDIFFKSPFGQFKYRVVHHDSPDPRGIDVALLYDPGMFTLVDSAFIQPPVIRSGSHPTRDILYAALKTGRDTLRLFVNHWPSKYGGPGYTEPFRREAADTLRTITDSLQNRCDRAFIICTGDFNDVPESTSLRVLVSESAPDGRGNGLSLFRVPFVNPGGTIRYQGQWQTIDHFFLSEDFFDGRGGFVTRSSCAQIYSPAFLLETDEKYGGLKPFRMYSGMKYNGGVSDHLPVMLKVYHLPSGE